MSVPRPRGRPPLSSRVHPRACPNDNWHTYQPLLSRLQLDPKFQATFYEDIVHPYRQKNKVLLKRGTPASFGTLTRNLLRAYGKRVWGNRSHWLVGGARDGTERPGTGVSGEESAAECDRSESGSAVGVEESDTGAEEGEEVATPVTATETATATREEDRKGVEGAEERGETEAATAGDECLGDGAVGEAYWGARGYHDPLNEWMKPVYVNARNVMWTPDDIAIQDLVDDDEDAEEEPSENTQQEQEEGDEAEDEVEEEEEAGINVANLYIDVPEDKEKWVSPIGYP